MCGKGTFLQIRSQIMMVNFLLPHHKQAPITHTLCTVYEQELKIKIFLLPTNRGFWWHVGFIHLSFVSVHITKLLKVSKILCNIRIFTQFISMLFNSKIEVCKNGSFCSAVHIF